MQHADIAAVFGAFATAGAPGWFTTLPRSTIGLAPEGVAAGVAIVHGIDPILDMARTATNAAGQVTVPVPVARGGGLVRDGAETSAEEREPV